MSRWYNESGKNSDIILVSRIRLLRNFAGWPFPGQESESEVRALLSLAEEKLSDLSAAVQEEVSETPAGLFEESERQALKERHIINNAALRTNHDYRLFTSESEDFSLTVNVEDHVRLLLSRRGDCLTELWEKISYIDDYIDSCIPYALDRTKDDLTLQDITRAGINFLMKKQGLRDGFFFMVEGGKIDWACHANDPTFISELIDMDNAIKIAYEFYQQHPDETLIVVSADHETGGLVLGRGAYELNLKAVSYQRMSMVKLDRELKAKKEKLGDKFTWDEAKKFLTENFGFWDGVKLDEDQTKRLETSFNEFKEGKADAGRLCSTVKHVISEAAMIGWQSGGHSNGYVPAFAIGVGAEQFHGRFDNTEICKKMAKAAGWKTPFEN